MGEPTLGELARQIEQLAADFRESRTEMREDVKAVAAQLGRLNHVSTDVYLADKTALELRLARSEESNSDDHHRLRNAEASIHMLVPTAELAAANDRRLDEVDKWRARAAGIAVGASLGGGLTGGGLVLTVFEALGRGG
jgi:hypothetical protein